MRKNRSTRLANRVGSITKLEELLIPLREAAAAAAGRDILPTRNRVQTHEAAIEILRSRGSTGSVEPTAKTRARRAGLATPAVPAPRKSRKATPVVIASNKMPKLSEGSEGLWFRICDAYDNWSGSPPTYDVFNDTDEKVQKGHLTDLKKKGLLTTYSDVADPASGRITWITLTPLGEELRPLTRY